MDDKIVELCKNVVEQRDPKLRTICIEELIVYIDSFLGESCAVISDDSDVLSEEEIEGAKTLAGLKDLPYKKRFN